MLELLIADVSDVLDLSEDDSHYVMEECCTEIVDTPKHSTQVSTEAAIHPINHPTNQPPNQPPNHPSTQPTTQPPNHPPNQPT